MISTLPVLERVAQHPADRPRLLVVVDTEEEFDWDAPYSRENVSVSAMRHVHRTQTIFDRFGVKPTYVIDYPVASTPDGFLPLAEIADDGRCTIGAHVHPWVNPPHDETLSVRHSFLMNLTPSLQEAKLKALVDMIGPRFGAPRVFKAGRYGLGEATLPILERLGFQVDGSVCPRHDFHGQGGPSYTGHDSTPFFLTAGLLELPCTVDYTGWAGAFRPGLHRAASHPRLAAMKPLGVLAKTGTVNRIMLSPEGNTYEEMRQLVLSLLKEGLRTFTFSFHSPSVEPGHTPYVRTSEDLARFLSTIERFCDFFFGEIHGVSVTPLEYRSTLLSPAGISR